MAQSTSPASGSGRQVERLLIGGAEGYLGYQATCYFSRKGMRVAASCRTGADEAKTRARLAEDGIRGVSTHVADLGDDGQVQSLVSAAERQLGGIDALFNAAGGFRWSKTEDLAVSDFDFLMSANVRSAWLLAKHVVPRFRAQDFGRLVFVSARGTLAASEAGMGAYTASKAALNAIVTGLAAELKTTNVRVNAVLPTVIDTPANRQAMPDSDPKLWVSTDALLGIVHMMLSAEGAVLNGALLPVAGGL